MSVLYLKIAQGCYGKSVQLGILNQVEFYYSLKKIHSNGFFENGTLVNTIQRHIGYTNSTIWKKVKQLTSLGLMYKHKQGYRLASYDKLFSILGYDITTGEHRKGTFKIHKIPTNTINDIKSWLALVDIRDNLNAQTHKAHYNLHKDKRYQYTENNLHCASLRDKRQILNHVAKKTVQMIQFNEESIMAVQLQQAYCKRDDDKVYCNPDVTLSLKGICRILGLSNTSSAHNIVQRMKINQLISVQSRMVRVGSTCIDYDTYIKQYSDLYILKQGVLWRRVPNKITVGV